MGTLQEAYEMAKKNDGAPGIDGVTFEAIEESGMESFLERIREELITARGHEPTVFARCVIAVWECFIVRSTTSGTDLPGFLLSQEWYRGRSTNRARVS